MTKNDDPFDLDGLRVNPGDATLMPSAERAARRKRQFIKVPLVWADRLGAVRRVATFKVALRLLRLHFRDHGQPVRLGNLALVLDNVSRRQKGLALAELERLGLVHVERRPRASPVVTAIVDPE
jgi:hypothetical protein